MGSPQEGSATGSSAAPCHTGIPSAAVPLQGCRAVAQLWQTREFLLQGCTLGCQTQGLWDHCPQELPGWKQGSVNGRLHMEAYSVTRFAKLSKNQTAVIRWNSNNCFLSQYISHNTDASSYWKKAETCLVKVWTYMHSECNLWGLPPSSKYIATN